MTTDSGNKALAAKIQLAVTKIQSSIRYSPYDKNLQEAFAKLNEVKAALESTPSVLEALEAEVKALKEAEESAPQHQYKPALVEINAPLGLVQVDIDAKITAYDRVLTLLKNAQRTASEGSEK